MCNHYKLVFHSILQRKRFCCCSFQFCYQLTSFTAVESQKSWIWKKENRAPSTGQIGNCIILIPIWNLFVFLNPDNICKYKYIYYSSNHYTFHLNRVHRLLNRNSESDSVLKWKAILHYEILFFLGFIPIYLRMSVRSCHTAAVNKKVCAAVRCMGIPRTFLFSFKKIVIF